MLMNTLATVCSSCCCIWSHSKVKYKYIYTVYKYKYIMLVWFSLDIYSIIQKDIKYMSIQFVN